MNPSTEVIKINPEYYKHRLKIIMDNPEPEIFKIYKEKYGKPYVKGVVEGVKDALILDDTLGIITPKSPNKK